MDHEQLKGRSKSVIPAHAGVHLSCAKFVQVYPFVRGDDDPRKFPAPYSLLPTPYSLFPTPYSLFPTPYSLLC